MPKSLREILEVGLSLDPRERFSSMHAVADALEQVLIYDRLVAFQETEPLEVPAPTEEHGEATSDLRVVNHDGRGDEGNAQLDGPPQAEQSRANDSVPEPGEVEIVPEPSAGVDANVSRGPWVSALIGGCCSLRAGLQR